MPLKMLLFALGVIAFGYSPYLPSLWWLLCLLPLFLCCWYWPRLWYGAALVAGVAWGIVAGHQLQQQQLPAEFVGRDVVVECADHAAYELLDYARSACPSAVEKIRAAFTLAELRNFPRGSQRL